MALTWLQKNCVSLFSVCLSKVWLHFFSESVFLLKVNWTIWNVDLVIYCLSMFMVDPSPSLLTTNVLQNTAASNLHNSPFSTYDSCALWPTVVTLNYKWYCHFSKRKYAKLQNIRYSFFHPSLTLSSTRTINVIVCSSLFLYLVFIAWVTCNT